MVCTRTVLLVTTSGDRRRHLQRQRMWLILALPLAAVIIYLLIWYGPDVLARHDVGNVTGPLRALRLQQARDAARGRLLTLGAGLFAAGALYFTGRNFRVARQTLEVTEQGQVTDRYTKAIEQLGSEKLDVRIGGIYALERIGHDSARDHPTVMEVLSEFIRAHSREPLTPGGTPEGKTRRDVQAAVAVIGRRTAERDIRVFDLHGVFLAEAILDNANITSRGSEQDSVKNANPSAYLGGVDFSRATLKDANLVGASLVDAKFIGANLTRAKLTDADLTDADLTPADPTGPNFIRADLTGADLTGADLTGAKLTYAKLTGTDLTGAVWSHDAEPPADWEREVSSGRLKRILARPMPSPNPPA
jgi:hypothetical protein